MVVLGLVAFVGTGVAFSRLGPVAPAVVLLFAVLFAVSFWLPVGVGQLEFAVPDEKD